MAMGHVVMMQMSRIGCGGQLDSRLLNIGNNKIMNMFDSDRILALA